MNIQTVLVAFILFLAAVFAGCLAYFVSRKHGAAGVTPFLILTISLAEWSLTYGLEILSNTLAAKTFWAQFQYIGISIIPVGWFLFAQAYSGNEKWGSLRRIILLNVIPVITILEAFTNKWYNLIWAEYTLDNTGTLSIFHTVRYGFGWWLFFAFSYILLFWGSLVILFAYRHRGEAYRRQFALILVALILPWGANALFLAHLSPIPNLDLSPIAFTISAAIFSWGMFQFRLFDLVPVSSQPVIQRLDAAAVVLDLKSRIVEINPAAYRLLSSPSDDPVGMSVEKAFDWWGSIDPEQRDAIEAQQDITLNIDGMRCYFSLQITPIWNSSSKLTGRFVILRDVTGDKLAGEAMALAQVKTEFLAKIGHELRSPLTSILGVAEMMDYGVYGNLTEDQLGAVKMIFDSSQQMTRIVNDLLQQSRIERGTFRLDITEFVFADILDRLYKQEKPAAKVKGLEFNTEIAPDLPRTIRGDSLRLYQILSNLTDNAIKYTHKGKVLARLFKVDNQHFAFEVSDTGVGIPKELQRIIFNPFQQIDATSSQKESGFGLGLSIVKQLISLMDGEIKLISEVGIGSTFTVILPFEPAWEKKE
jgi:signal transduction histidine kinase